MDTKTLENKKMMEELESNLKMTIDERYLIKPFNELINSKDFATTKNIMNIIVGTTGLGKTYQTFNSFIPTLFEKHKLQLVVYSYPGTEIFDEFEANKLIANTKGVVLALDVYDALEKLKSGFQVFLCGTHHRFTNINGKSFFRRVESEGYTLGWFVDEPHTWMVSDIENYRVVKGSFTPVYDAVLYKQVAKVAQRTPYIFGTTATPTAEQTKLVQPRGSLTFNIINEYPNLNGIIHKCGWLGGVTQYDLQGLSTDQGWHNTVDTFRNAIDNHIRVSSIYGKRTMMITAERQNGSYGYTVEQILKFIKEYLKDTPQEDITDLIAVLTSDFKGFVNFPRCGFGRTLTETHVDENEIKRNLNDPDHPCQILVVVEKGKMGMNIHNLKTYFSFRKTDKERGESYNNEPITESSLQIIGRFQRIWTGESNKDFTDKWGYDLTEYVKSLDNDDIKRLLILNSYNIYVPNNAMWFEAIRILKKYLSPTTSMARAWINNIRS